jgi:hypothetical protein
VLRNAPTVTLAAFVIANTQHTVNHGVDVHIGGESAAVYGLGALSLIGAIALAVRVTALRRRNRLQRELNASTLAREDQP